MRLDKYLADMGIGTRSEIKKAIRAKAVTVNTQIVRDPAAQVSENDVICFQGKPVKYESFVYYMLHKPAGIISASSDSREKTVVDLIASVRKDLFPVGRLDRDTEGLLLITNDGALAHRLLSPKHHVDKVYLAVVTGVVTPEDIDAFRDGIRLEDGTLCRPAELEIFTPDEIPDPAVRESFERLRHESLKHEDAVSSETKSSQEDDVCLLRIPPEQKDIHTTSVNEAAHIRTLTAVRITIHEGKFHQIKRMFQVRGKEVLYLKRISMGSLTLDPELPAGGFRRLTPSEVENLL